MSKKEKKEFVCPVHKVPLKPTRVNTIMHRPGKMKFLVCPECGYLAMFLEKPAQVVVVKGRPVKHEVSFG